MTVKVFRAKLGKKNGILSLPELCILRGFSNCFLLKSEGAAWSPFISIDLPRPLPYLRQSIQATV